MAYLMPDGRTLAAVLAADAADAERNGVRRRVRASVAARGLEARWRRAERREAGRGSGLAPSGITGGGGLAGPGPGARPDGGADHPDVGRLGRARRRRALNDRLLRELAGPLSFSAIEGLFKPAPFGGGVPSALALAADSDALGPFIGVDPDRQDRALAAWEALVVAGREVRGRPAAGVDAAAADGLTRWAAVEPRARAALKRAGPRTVDDVEAPVLHWLGQGPGEVAGAPAPGAAQPTAVPPSLVRPCDDSYGALLLRGVAQFHGLAARRGPAGAGEHGLVLERRREGVGGAGAGGGDALPPGGVTPPASALAATCGDVLHALSAARPAGLSLAGLRAVLLEHAAPSAAA